jgi:hypothetical protein
VSGVTLPQGKEYGCLCCELGHVDMLGSDAVDVAVKEHCYMQL